MSPAAFEDIRKLFREKDREEMLWAFDLSNADDVRLNADVILARLEAGDMPCDNPWSEEDLSVFRNWFESGSP